MRESMDTIRGIANRTGCAIIVIHHTGQPKYDENGTPLPMTPRGHSSISDTVDLELQILATEHENITTLLCTKSRRTANVVRKGWHRDFFYDENSLIITPLNETSEEKQTLVDRLVIVKEALNLSNVALAKEIGVHERTVRRWLAGEYPSELQIIRVRGVLSRLQADFSDETRLKFVALEPDKDLVVDLVVDLVATEGQKDEPSVVKKTSETNLLIKNNTITDSAITDSEIKRDSEKRIADSAIRKTRKTTTTRP
jgi:hypothetical protein